MYCAAFIFLGNALTPRLPVRNDHNNLHETPSNDCFSPAASGTVPRVAFAPPRRRVKQSGDATAGLRIVY
jgi:hypothetical protein